MLMVINDMDGLVKAIDGIVHSSEEMDTAAEYMDCELPREWLGEDGNRRLRELRLRITDMDWDDMDDDAADKTRERVDGEAYDLLRAADVKFPVYAVATGVSYDVYSKVLVHWYDASEVCGLEDFIEFVEQW